MEVESEVPWDDVQVDNGHLLFTSVPHTRPQPAPLLAKASQVSAYGEHWAGHDAIDVRPNMRGDEVTDPGVWRPTSHVIHPIFPHICPTPGHQLSIRLGTEAELGAGEVNKHVAGGGHGTLGGQANTKQLFEAPVCVGGAAVVNCWVEYEGECLAKLGIETVTIFCVIADWPYLETKTLITRVFLNVARVEKHSEASFSFTSETFSETLPRIVYSISGH